MPTLKNPASDLASSLNGQTLGGVVLTAQDNLFYRNHEPTPASLHVQLLNAGGAPPEPYLQGATPQAYFQATVQCLVWGCLGEEGYDQADALARAVLGYLQQSIPSGYVSILANDSQPTFFEDRDTQRQVFSINFTARYVG
jgi:hypothetical protein